MAESRREKEARRQRMLARERGELPAEPETRNPEPPQTDAAGPPASAPRTENARETRRARTGSFKPPKPRQAESARDIARGIGVAEPRRQGFGGKLQPLSPILRRRRRRRRLAVVALVLAVLVALGAYTGTLTAISLVAGDAADSAMLYLQRGGGWPVSTGIETPTRVETLAGGFVEMDAEDVAVYSAYGSEVRTIQPGYARPAISVGNTRFVLYDRAGTELRVESRTRTLHTITTEQGIMLCSLSANGTLAVVTESDRYVAELQVLDPTRYRTVFTWLLTQDQGTPIEVAFAPDNRRFAVGTVAARDGQLASTVYCMEIGSTTATARYTATAGSMVLRLQWLSGSRLLAVFDTYAALLDPATGAELARYDYEGSALQGISVQGSTVALLLSAHSGNTLALLDTDLAPVGEIDAGQAASVTCADSEAYLIENNTVLCYGLDGTLRWEQEYATRPLYLLNAAEPLLFTAGRVEVLTAPAA